MRKFAPNNLFNFLLPSILFFASCKESFKGSMNKNKSIERKVDSLLALMTLEEKIGQMSQIRHFEENAEKEIKSKYIGSVIHTQGPLPGEGTKEWQAKFVKLQKAAMSTRLGIPLLFAVDAVHGQNTFNGATIFPHNIGLGATRNAELVEQIARITAIEAQATGFNWVFAPCVAIPYNEKWGRFYEAFSENTELTKELTRASVRGYQGDLTRSNTVLATAKHFIGDGATNFGYEGGETNLDQDEIVARLLPPYQVAVEEGVGAIMASFNTLNGLSMHANKEYITDLLKDKMGFDGMVISDWKGYSRFGENSIINAGVDMVMAVDGDLSGFQEGLKKGVEEKEVSLERIDDAVRRILRQKFRLGLFENPFPDKNLIAKIGHKDHRSIARQAVRESLVLLKNTKDVLPLDKKIKKIVVVGEHANNSGLQSGGWTVNWQGTTENYRGATTILEGIKRIAKGEVVYDRHGTEKHKDADVAIIVIGETPYAEFFGDIGDGKGAYKLTVDNKHQEYIETYVKMGVKVITVLVSGRPLVVTKQINQSDAFIAAWLLGSEGEGLADVLFGNYNFKGKLPHTWPKDVNDFQKPFGPNYWNTTSTPLYEYGYGLEY